MLVEKSIIFILTITALGMEPIFTAGFIIVYEVIIPLLIYCLSCW
jgi:hypothetical protein